MNIDAKSAQQIVANWIQQHIRNKDVEIENGLEDTGWEQEPGTKWE